MEHQFTILNLPLYAQTDLPIDLQARIYAVHLIFYDVLSTHVLRLNCCFAYTCVNGTFDCCA